VIFGESILGRSPLTEWQTGRKLKEVKLNPKEKVLSIFGDMRMNHANVFAVVVRVGLTSFKGKLIPLAN